VDEAGVEWFYEERADEIDDKWQVLAMATVPGRGQGGDTTIGLLCVEGLGRKVRLEVRGWRIREGDRRLVQVRVDREPAFDLPVVGDSSPHGTAYVGSPESAQRLVAGMLSARERIVLRDDGGITAIIPMRPSRPELQQAIRWCREIAAAVQ
jgi:hypothetical protein